MRKKIFWFFLILIFFIIYACCSIPLYEPSYWNDGGVIQSSNNCYNYANNNRTDTYAQPGRAAGAMYNHVTCSNVYNAAVADGLMPLPPSGVCPDEEDKLGLVVAPGWDYHWYRQDKGGMWSHKVGMSRVTNLDNSRQPITDPETANRGIYTDFCGYLCSCSSDQQGKGNEFII